jgi:N-methylhydantoinase B
MNALMIIFSRMLMTVDEFRGDLIGAGPGYPLLVLAGTDDRDNYFGTAIMDTNAMGSGARAFSDGVDTSGPSWSPLIRIPNVEANEQWYPIVFIYRRELIDGGGAGRWRGGTGMEIGVAPYRARHVELISNTGGQAVSTHGAMGAFGGYPSPTARFLVAKDTNTRSLSERQLVPEHIDKLEASERVLLRGKSNGTPIEPDDFVESTFTGGGGHGDPLEREPERVVRDIALGYVSGEAAASLYGVAITADGSLDAPKTERLRAKELASRATWQPASKLTGEAPGAPFSEASGDPERQIHEYLVAKDADGMRVLACSRCGHVASDYRGNYKLGLLADTQPVTLLPHVIDPTYFLDPEMILRRFCCPGCRVLMAVELVREGEPVLWEFRFA